MSTQALEGMVDASDARVDPRAWGTLAVASLAVFIATIDSTILFVAFPSIRRSFPAVSASSLSWILNAYTIGYGAFLVPAGRLADRFGRRRFFLAGLAAFALASALCGAAESVTFMIVARALQAVGAAMLMPASFALVLDAFPLRRRGVAVGLWGASSALAAALGPSVGSAIVQFASWRWGFLVNVPIGAVGIVAGSRSLRESRVGAGEPLPDFVGSVMLAASLAGIAFGIVGSKEHPSAILAGAGAVALLALFVRRSSHAAVPALDLRLFRSRNFAVGNAITLVFSAGFTAMFFGNVFFLTERWHLTIFEAGLWVTPGPLSVIPVAIISGRIADRVGYRRLFVTGGILFALGGLWLTFLRGTDPNFFSAWLPGSIVLGAGIGMVLPSLGAAAAVDLAPTAFGAGSGVNQAIRQFGSVLGVASVFVVLGNLGPGAPFERVFSLIIVAGIATSIGGALLPPRTARENSPGGEA